MLQITFIKKWIFSLTCLLNSWEKIVLSSFLYNINYIYIYIYYFCDYSYNKWKYNYEIHYSLLNYNPNCKK